MSAGRRPKFVLLVLVAALVALGVWTWEPVYLWVTVARDYYEVRDYFAEPVRGWQPKRRWTGIGHRTGSAELFYRNGEQLMVVEITTGQIFSAGVPAPLFAAAYAPDTAGGGAGNPNYDISPDGEQFIFVEQNSSIEGSAQIHVVLNWTQELLERVPVN